MKKYTVQGIDRDRQRDRKLDYLGGYLRVGIHNSRWRTRGRGTHGRKGTHETISRRANETEKRVRPTQYWAGEVALIEGIK